MLLRRSWPWLAGLIIVLELIALFDGFPENTISAWINDFPFVVWLSVIAFLGWVIVHLIVNRIKGDDNEQRGV